MKMCVFGAGAVGGYLAARLLRAGSCQLSVVARGEQLRTIARDGLRLITAQEDFVVRPAAVTDRPHDLPPQDVVLVTLKAHAQPAAAPGIAALLGRSGTAVFVNNGIPWWWTYRGDAPAAGPLPLLDPEGALWTQVRPERVIGCVVYSANEVVRPGVVRHAANNRWLLGEPDGSRSERMRSIAQCLRNAGLGVEEVSDIRSQVWAKLLRNASLNPLAALTRLTVERIGQVPGLAELCAAVVDEIVAVAAADGTDLAGEAQAARAAPQRSGALEGPSAGSIRPSMLQDVLAGRALETEAILGQVQVFARASGTPTPRIDVLLPLLRGLGAA